MLCGHCYSHKWLQHNWRCWEEKITMLTLLRKLKDSCERYLCAKWLCVLLEQYVWHLKDWKYHIKLLNENVRTKITCQALKVEISQAKRTLKQVWKVRHPQKWDSEWKGKYIKLNFSIKESIANKENQVIEWKWSRIHAVWLGRRDNLNNLTTEKIQDGMENADSKNQQHDQTGDADESVAELLDNSVELTEEDIELINEFLDV